MRPHGSRDHRTRRARARGAALLAALIAVSLCLAPGAGASLQDRLDHARASERALSGQVAGYGSRIAGLQSQIAPVEARLAGLQGALDRERARIAAIQTRLAVERRRLARLQHRLALGQRLLARHLVAAYETNQPDLVTVVLESDGFKQVLERLAFMKRVRSEDVRIVAAVRRARTEVIAEATRLGALEAHAQSTAAAMLTQRNAVAAARLTLVNRRIVLENARATQAAQLGAARAERARIQQELSRLQARAAALQAAPPPVPAPAASAPAPSSGPAPAPSGGGGFVFPLPKGAASGPGSWSQDQGVDISAPGHTPLYAVGSGTVVLHGIGGFGDWAPVLHLDSGEYVYYGHAGPGNAVPLGTHVGAGAVIGEVGAGIVGISTGPHLEIGFSDASGTPAGGTSGRMLALLQGSY